jgi:hypothetical protein
MPLLGLDGGWGSEGRGQGRLRRTVWEEEECVYAEEDSEDPFSEDEPWYQSA